MLVFLSLLLALIPAVVILYPFLWGSRRGEPSGDEGSAQADLSRRFDAALAGLKNAELEWAIGNLAREDYRWFRRQYSVEVAMVMRAMEMEEDEEEALLATIRAEVQQVRRGILGSDGRLDATTCPQCASPVEPEARRCPGCGEPIVAGPQAQSGHQPSGRASE